MLTTTGFAISTVVRDDPKEMTVQFGGQSGRRIRANYLAILNEAAQGEHAACVRASHMFQALSAPRCPSYTFRSELGLLSATQFTQPALTLSEAARFADLQARGVVPTGPGSGGGGGGVRFAGHSLGEYGALAALGGGLMPVEKLAAITFVRGLTMQLAVARDAASGRSAFSMCAVNPSKVGRGFDEAALERVVAAVAAHSPGWLLEVVNYNVRDMQYICAGHTRALACLTAVLGGFGAAAGDAVAPWRDDDAALEDMVRARVDEALVLAEPWEYERGPATVPLRLIDVPFHSSFLAGGIETYRRFLRSQLRREEVSVEALVGRWIPNVTGRAFGVSRAHVEDMYRVTGSDRLGEILGNWDAPSPTADAGELSAIDSGGGSA